MNIVEILPSNRTRLEEGFVVAFDNLLRNGLAEFSGLTNAERCQNEALLYLANDRGVPEWERSLDENVKRDLIGSFWPSLKLIGTAEGINKGLSSLDANVDVTPWYKADLQPYHLDVITWLDVPPSVEFIDALHSVLNRTKLERDVVNLTIGLNAEDSRYQGGALQLTTHIEVVPHEPSLDPVEGDHFRGGAVQLFAFIEVNSDH